MKRRALRSFSYCVGGDELWSLLAIWGPGNHGTVNAKVGPADSGQQACFAKFEFVLDHYLSGELHGTDCR
jgi:hypothetical protein